MLFGLSHYCFIILVTLIGNVFRVWIQGDIIDEKMVELDLKMLTASKQNPKLAYLKVEDTTNVVNPVPTPTKPLYISKEKYTIEYHDTKMILPWKMHLASPMMRGK